IAADLTRRAVLVDAAAGGRLRADTLDARLPARAIAVAHASRGGHAELGRHAFVGVAAVTHLRHGSARAHRLGHPTAEGHVVAEAEREPARRLARPLRLEDAAPAGGLGAAAAAHRAAPPGGGQHSEAEHRVARTEFAVADRLARAAAARVTVPDALPLDAATAALRPIGQDLAGRVHGLGRADL